MSKMPIVLSILLLHAFAAAAGAQQTKPPATRVILLGTGTPNADPERSGPATAVVVGSDVYLVDAGPGVVRRASAAGLEVARLNRVFFTHLHSDHTLGFPDLIFTPWVLERSAPLEAFGPPGLASMSAHLLSAWSEDIAVRTRGLEGANATGYRVNAREFVAGAEALVVYRDANVTVKAFAVPHGSWKHAYGYRFETPGRVIVISGDTAASPAMIEHARGADLLIHEVYCQAAWKLRPEKWQRYHREFHTASRDLARIAEAAQPKLLVLHHVLLWGARPEQLLAEIREIYKGRVVIGSDLEVF
jgi:ribonuclease Z